MSASPLRTATVNAALKRSGLKATLHRDRSGYHYFSGDDIPSGISSGIYVYRTAAHTVEEWVQMARDLKEAKV